MLGSNVKVHFAGSDGSKENFCALVAADTRYRLYSCYNYIVNKKPDDDFRLPEDDIILEQQKQRKHVIQGFGPVHPDVWCQQGPSSRPSRP